MSQHLYWACYALIINNEWKVLLGQRKNTRYFDWWWNLIAWHIETWELASDAMMREIKEECWLVVTKEMIKAHHIIHRVVKDDREYFDISYTVTWWEWIPSITEPNKCSALERFDVDNIHNYMALENKRFIELYKKNPQQGGFEELYVEL